MARYLRYIELIPKKIRERLVIEIHGIPKEIRAAQIAELQKPILAHCLHTIHLVSPLYRNFNMLKQMSDQIVGVELGETRPRPSGAGRAEAIRSAGQASRADAGGLDDPQPAVSRLGADLVPLRAGIAGRPRRRP